MQAWRARWWSCLGLAWWTCPKKERRRLRTVSQHMHNEDIRPVFISHSTTFLSVCGTWIYRLLPALHAHLPCTTLLNSEECALLEKRKKRGGWGTKNVIQYRLRRVRVSTARQLSGKLHLRQSQIQFFLGEMRAPRLPPNSHVRRSWKASGKSGFSCTTLSNIWLSYCITHWYFKYFIKSFINDIDTLRRSAYNTMFRVHERIQRPSNNR